MNPRKPYALLVRGVCVGEFRNEEDARAAARLYRRPGENLRDLKISWLDGRPCSWLFPTGCKGAIARGTPWALVTLRLSKYPQGVIRSLHTAEDEAVAHWLDTFGDNAHLVVWDIRTRTQGIGPYDL